MTSLQYQTNLQYQTSLPYQTNLLGFFLLSTYIEIQYISFYVFLNYCTNGWILEIRDRGSTYALLFINKNDILLIKPDWLMLFLFLSNDMWKNNKLILELKNFTQIICHVKDDKHNFCKQKISSLQSSFRPKWRDLKLLQS